MGSIGLLIIAIALSMDAFAVAISKGLSMKKNSFKKALLVAIFFGGFQAGMPVIGYYLGIQFSNKISALDHWVAFILLAVIGLNMIKESRSEEEKLDDSFSLKNLTVLAVATSIDALAVGITFALIKTSIFPAVAMIGTVTFLFSLVGVQIGNLFGCKFKAKAELAGGIILIGMGIKIVIEHTILL